MIVAADSRFCEQCVSVKPLAEFRRRSRNGSARLNQCRECHNQSERKRRATKRSKHDHRRMAKYLTQLKNERSNARVELLLGVMIEQFGGTQGFLAAWSDYHHRAMHQGGFAAFRCFQSVARLMQFCEQNHADPGELSDEELEQTIMDHTKHLIQQNPVLAVAAADQIGWTVIPPG